MLNQELELSLNMAFARAREHRHDGAPVAGIAEQSSRAGSVGGLYG